MAPSRAPSVVAPAPTVASFERLTGVDLGFVEVVRGPEVTREATRRAARAYTSAGVVSLPEEHGPLDGHNTQALLAHELAHVMQQRALGPAATETGPWGSQLESQAEAVERAFRGEAVSEDELAWPADLAPAPATLSWTPQLGFNRREPVSDQQPAPAEAQRAPLTETVLPAPLAPARDVEMDPGSDSLTLNYPTEDERPSRADEPSPGVAELSDDDIERIASRVGPRTTRHFPPPLDFRDPDLLDILAGGLYPRIRHRLRTELLDDRERAGLLTEFG